jgi:hypothetical protein
VDLKRKLEIARRDIAYIARADDKDSATRDAALAHLADFIAAERKGVQERVQASIAKQMSGDDDNKRPVA